MSTDPKPPKPMPSADEINAYLELSAARTRMRLPLAKGNAIVGTAGATAPSGEKGAARALPISASKKLPTQREEPAASGASGPGSARPSGPAESPDAAWRPFATDEDA
ncbi:MAG TPA: hypothetical protein VMG12_16740 [Polyangiaceae bacterium]|nr:hypothetical protein [Polyangiaceae bacterium]